MQHIRALEDEFNPPQVDPFAIEETEPALDPDIAAGRARLVEIATGDLALAETARKELERTGRSTTIDNMYQEFDNYQAEKDQQDINNVVTSTDDEETIAEGLGDLQIKFESRRPYTLETIALINAARKAVPESENERVITEEAVTRLEDTTILGKSLANSELQRQVLLKYGVTDPGGALSIGQEFIAAGILPTFTPGVAYILNQVYPDIAGLAQFPAIGHGLEEFWLRFREEPQERKLEIIAKITKAANEYANIGTKNQFLETDLVRTFLEEVDPSDSDITFNKYINNIFAAFDIVPAFGKTIRSAAHSIFPSLSRNSTVNLLRGVTASKAKEMAERIIARQGNNSPEDLKAITESVYDSILPKPRGGGNSVGTSLNGDFGVDDLPEELTDFSSYTYSPLEIETKKASIIDRIESGFGGIVGTHQIDRMEVEQIPGGFRVLMKIGFDASSGFSTLKAARSVAKTYREFEGNALAIIYRKDPATGDLVEVSAKTPANAKGEFFIFTRKEEYLGVEDVLASEQRGVFVGHTGTLAKWLDKSTLFKQWFVNTTNTADHIGERARAVLRQVRTPFDRLGRTQMQRATNILEAQELDEVWYSIPQLISRAEGDLSVVRGVLAVRKSNAIMRNLLNTSTYRELRSQGWDALSVHGQDMIGKRLTAIDVKGAEVTVFDSASKKFVKLARDVLQQSIDDGTRVLYKARTPYRIADEESSLVVSTPNDKFVRLRDLPTEIIRNIPGYIPRIYDANYIIARKGFMTTDGVKHPIVHKIGIAHTKGQARKELEAHKALMKDPEKAEELTIIPAKEITDINDLKFASRQSIEYLEESGQLFTSPRGPKLAPLSEPSMDGRRGLRSVVDSLDISLHRAANTLGLNSVIDIATKRWEKVYGKHYGIADSNGVLRMPLSGPIGKHNLETDIDDALRDEALTARDHIALLAGVDNTWFRRNYRNAMIRVSNLLSDPRDPKSIGNMALNALTVGKKRRENLAKLAIDLKDTTPFDFLKRYNFIVSIALAPIRQFILNANQASIYINAPHAAAYFATGKASRDWIAVSMHMSTHDKPVLDKVKKSILSKLGMTPEEVDRIGRAWRSSGMGQSIDAHQYSVGMVNSLPGIMGKNEVLFSSAHYGMLARTIRNTVEAARKIGFDAGEYTQLLTAWLVERNRWIKSNPKIADEWDTAEHIAEISANARARSGNMTKSGTSALNRGMSGVFFQFMSHTMKMIQILTPDTRFTRGISNKFFSNSEKARIATTQLLIYGTGAAGITAAFDKAFPNAPEEVKEVVREGIWGTMINMTARAAAGENVWDVKAGSSEVSSSIAPFSGIIGIAPSSEKMDATPITRVFEVIFSSNPDVLAQLVGVSAVNQNRFWTQFGNALAMMGVPTLHAEGSIAGIPNPFTMTRSPGLQVELVKGIPSAIDEMLRIIPTYNNFVKYRAAERIGIMYNTQNKLGIPVTKSEAVLRGILGTQSHLQARINDAILDMQGVTQEIKEPDADDFNEIANVLYNRNLAYIRKWSDEQIPDEELKRLGLLETWTIFGLFNDLEREAVRQAYYNKVMDDRNYQTGITRFSELMISGLKSGKIRESKDTIDFLESFPDFEEKEELLGYVKLLNENFYQYD